MNRILCKPCLAFEALASLVFCNCCRQDIPEASAWIKNTYNGVKVSPSDSYFKVLRSHHSMAEIEAFDVERLVEIYSEYTDNKELLSGLQKLKRSNFEKLWTDSLLPVLEDQCRKFLSVCDSEKVDRLLSDIENIHGKSVTDDITVYMTYFTSNISFLLTPSCYLTNAPVNCTLDPVDTLSLFTHELCHGFAKEKTVSSYIGLFSSCDYLKRSYFFLSKIVGESGYEEEFVVAIENAIAVKQGLKTYEEALDKLSRQYRNSIPVAIILFSELNKLDSLPDNINGWLCEEISKLTGSDHIEKSVNDIIPGYTDKFRSVWNDEKQKHPDRFIF